jgi:Ca2+-binding EF-hand superfamily protein
MSKLGVFLARQELRVIFDAFDLNKDGSVCYGELVNALKVSLLRAADDLIRCSNWLLKSRQKLK